MKRLTACVCAITLALSQIACNVSPASLLNVAAAELQVAANLPNLTPAEKTWLNAAAIGTACASSVLLKAEPAAQEAIDITACFAALPIIPSADQPYIQLAIGAVEAFVVLYDSGFAVNTTPGTASVRSTHVATESKVAVESNAAVRAGKHLSQFTAAMSRARGTAWAVEKQLAGHIQ
jgi:hypothetical protein